MKKALSILLSLALILSVCALGAVSVSAAEPSDAPQWEQKSDGTIYFYADPSIWKAPQKMTCYLYEHNGNELIPWGSKKANMTDLGGNIWSYNPLQHGIILSEDASYGVIFTDDWNAQTIDLIIGTDCLGDMAYSTNQILENPVDDNKCSFRAAWVNADKERYGVPLTVTSIGNVVGEVPWKGETPYSILLDFLDPNNHFGLELAVKFNGMTGRQTAEHVAEGLGLSKEDLEKAVGEAGIDLDNYPGYTDNRFWFSFYADPFNFPDVTKMTAYIYSDEDGALFEWGTYKCDMEEGAMDYWYYDLTPYSVTLDPDKNYYVIFTADWKIVTNPLPLTNDCNTLTAYATGSELAPVDGKKQLEAKWMTENPYATPWCSFFADPKVFSDYDTMYAYIYSDDGAVFEWGSPEGEMEYSGGSMWWYDCMEHDIYLDPDKEYYIIFTADWTDFTNALPLSESLMGEMAAPTGTILSTEPDGTRKIEAEWAGEPAPYYPDVVSLYVDPTIIPPEGVQLYAYIYEEGEEEGTPFFPWGSKKCAMTEIFNQCWEYDLDAHGITLDPEKEYSVIFSANWEDITNALPLNDHLDSFAYLTGATLHQPTDSQRIFEAVWDDDCPMPDGPQWDKRDNGKIYFHVCEAMLILEFEPITATIYAYNPETEEESIVKTVEMQVDEDDRSVMSYDILADGFTFEPGIFYGISFSNGMDETIPVFFNEQVLGDLAVPKWVYSDKGYELIAYWVNTLYQPLAGDIDGDNKLTIQDVTLLQRDLAEFLDEDGYPIIDGFTFSAADFNRDGNADIQDVTAMQRVIAEFGT